MDIDPGPVADREWRLIHEESREGATQMAFDDAAAATAAETGVCTARLYQWEPSCLSLGRHQHPETVDWEVCADAGVDVTRRPTGGGGIYHDRTGDLSYSLIAPTDALPGDLLESYHLLCTPILAALRALGIDADYVDSDRAAVHQPACYLRELNPAHDIVADGGAGRKLAGNAQHRREDAVVQHGSISVSVDAEAHLDCFAAPETTPATFRDRVAGIDEFTDADRASVVAAFTEALATWTDAEAGSWTETELARADDRAAERYANDDWVRANPHERERE